MPYENGIPSGKLGHDGKNDHRRLHPEKDEHELIPGVVESQQRRESSLATSRLESAIDWTLEDWAKLIKNIGEDVPIEKFAEILFDTPAINDSSAAVKRVNNTTFEPLGNSIIDRDERSLQSKNRIGNDVTFEGIEPSNVSWRISPEEISLFKSRMLDDSTAKFLSSNNSTAAVKRTNNTTFEPLGNSIIDRDERSFQAKNRIGNDITFEGLEPSNVPWRLSPDEITLYKSRVLDDTTTKRLNVSSPKNQDTKNVDRSLLNTTSDLIDRLNSFPPDVSGCDMADMLLSPPSGTSTKERLAKQTSDFSDVPNMSTINDLLKSGLSSEELVDKLLGGIAASSKERKSLTAPRSTGTLARQVENPPVKNTSEEKFDVPDGSNESFAPMSTSMIDRDEASILAKYQLGRDITLYGIENSDITWQMSSHQISLFRENGNN